MADQVQLPTPVSPVTAPTRTQTGSRHKKRHPGDGRSDGEKRDDPPVVSEEPAAETPRRTGPHPKSPAKASTDDSAGNPAPSVGGRIDINV